jgi:hypothetical protein
MLKNARDQAGRGKTIAAATGPVESEGVSARRLRCPDLRVEGEEQGVMLIGEAIYV